MGEVCIFLSRFTVLHLVIISVTLTSEKSFKISLIVRGENNFSYNFIFQTVTCSKKDVVKNHANFD